MFTIRTLPRYRVLAHTRAFHSPFKVLANTSPLKSESKPHSYEKQSDHSPSPTVTHAGTQSYVVSEPDPSSKHYEVPTGAYPTTSPYQSFESVSYEGIEGRQRSSTSSDLAHPTLSKRVPKNGGGVGMMDKEGSDWELGLAERNPGPTDSEVVETSSRLGVKEAWKERK